MSESPTQSELQIEATQTVYATPAEPKAGMMIPHFETVALYEKARRLTHPFPSAGGWALSSLSMGVGVGTTAIALYAFDQQVDSAISAVLWSATVFLLLLALVMWRVRAKIQGVHDQAVDSYCDELKMLVHRYGGGGAAEVVNDMESRLPLAERRSLQVRLGELRFRRVPKDAQ